MKRILLDQGLAPATAIILRQDGWDAIHVGDIGLDRDLDPEILETVPGSGEASRLYRAALRKSFAWG